MNGDEPGAEDVGQVVQQVGVGDAVDGGVGGEREEERVGEVADAGVMSAEPFRKRDIGMSLPVGHPRNHAPRAERLDEQDKGHDG